MDDDDLRRGKPTVHKAFDEWTAILAGDALLTLAFELLAAPETHADAGVRTQLIAGLARASGTAGMAGGQCLDLEADKLGAARAARPRPHRAPAGHEDGRAHRLCLRGRRHPRARRRSSAPRRWRSSASGWEPPSRSPTTCSTSKATPGVIGKATGKDAGKATLVSLLGVPAARERLGLLEAQAIALLEPFGADADILRETARFVARRQA